MADDRWAADLNIDAKLVERFSEVSDDTGVPAAELVEAMVAKVVQIDDDVRLVGLMGLGAFKEREDRVKLVANLATSALPTDIRPSGLMWPAHVPFPWTAEECKAAVLGYQVRWRGSLLDYMQHLRGAWDVDFDDYVVLSRRGERELMGGLQSALDQSSGGRLP